MCRRQRSRRRRVPPRGPAPGWRWRRSPSPPAQVWSAPGLASPLERAFAILFSSLDLFCTHRSSRARGAGCGVRGARYGLRSTERCLSVGAAGRPEGGMRRRLFAGVKSLSMWGSKSRRGSPQHRSVSLPESTRRLTEPRSVLPQPSFVCPVFLMDSDASRRCVTFMFCVYLFSVLDVALAVLVPTRVTRWRSINTL